MPSVSEVFEIPKFYYFDSGNDYSGSKNDFSYKIVTGEKLKAMVWHGRLCSMKAEIEHEQEFERSEDGFASMIKWLEEMYSKG
ncbi:MAG: hypothetical protein NC247_11455 [Ruminococcus flavefaciens]|nr:hypothetical protein [Ruminococcus flavefaciens]MCM1360670.1 hypothetical protein [Clostridiales bacterium]MCM1435267.1 hypothetical protein [Ruminococcus flavefaciens]